MSIQETLDQIKYVAWHNIQVLDADKNDGAVTVRLPGRDDLLNYVGTGHAGAIYTLAETAAGVAADSVAQTMEAFILLRGAEVKYKRRAEGDLTATGAVSPDVAKRTRHAFTASSRADLAVEVDIRDPENQSVFQGIFNYALRPRN